MLIVDGVKYKLFKPGNEEKEFHPMVRQNSKEIFGKDSLYFDVKHILKTSSGIGSIPDAYVISPSQQQWYVVENELSSHPVYDHIVNQLTRFINGVENKNTRDQIIEMLYGAINENAEMRAILQKSIGSVDVHHFLTKLIKEPTRIVIVIDQKTPEVESACKVLGITDIIEFKTFAKENDPKTHAYLFETLSDSRTVREKSPTWEQKLRSATPETKAIVEELEKRIQALGKVSTMERMRKAYYKGKLSSKSCFAVIEIDDDGLVIRIDASSPTFKDPEKWSIDGIKNGMFFARQSKFKVTNRGQIEYSINLIKQAFDIIESKQ